MKLIKVFVFYDIPDDRERTSFSNYLKDIGLDRIQYSGFMGFMKKEKISELKERSKNIAGIIHLIVLSKCEENAVMTFGGYIPELQHYISI